MTTKTKVKSRTNYSKTNNKKSGWNCRRKAAEEQTPDTAPPTAITRGELEPKHTPPLY